MSDRSTDDQVSTDAQVLPDDEVVSSQRVPDRARRRPIIDCHTHVGRLRVDDDPLEPAALVAWMDANGIDRAVVHALESPESASVYTTSETVLEATAAYPHRLIPFCSFDPRINTIGRDTEHDFRYRIEEFVDRGARGFGEIKCGVPIDHPRLQLVYQLCGERGLPMLLHTDNQCLWDEVGLPGLERMLQTYPDANFIVHSHGWWSHISADVERSDLDRFCNPDGPIEPGGRCAHLLRSYDNLYADISAGSGWNAMTRDPDYARGFLDEFRDQIVFGTDRLSGYEPRHVELLDRYDLASETWDAICSTNLDRLLL